MLTLDQKDADSGSAWATCPDGGRKVVAPDTVGDPLLLTIDNIVLAILAKFGFTGQVGNIATGIRFGDGKTNALVSGQDTGQYPIHERFLTELDNRWAADTEASDEIPH